MHTNEFSRASTDSQAEVKALIAKIGTLSAEKWESPYAPGKWSPRQITEHVAIVYEEADAIVQGKSTIRPIPRIFRPILRLLVTLTVFKSGEFPKGLKAPKSFLPGSSPASVSEVIARLDSAVRGFETTAARSLERGESHIDHPLFGKFSVVSYLKLLTLHTKHHAAHVS